MKFFQVVSITLKSNGEQGDANIEWCGFDFDEAKKAKEQVCAQVATLSEHDRNLTHIEGRIFTLPDDIDINDDYVFAEALCRTTGYEFF